MRAIPWTLIVLLMAGCAQPDREKTRNSEDSPAIATALAAEDCKGGDIYFNEEESVYEVVNARCSDGHRYDLRLDTSFNVITKQRED